MEQVEEGLKGKIPQHLNVQNIIQQFDSLDFHERHIWHGIHIFYPRIFIQQPTNPSCEIVSPIFLEAIPQLQGALSLYLKLVFVSLEIFGVLRIHDGKIFQFFQSKPTVFIFVQYEYVGYMVNSSWVILRGLYFEHFLGPEIISFRVSMPKIKVRIRLQLVTRKELLIKLLFEVFFESRV